MLIQHVRTHLLFEESSDVFKDYQSVVCKMKTFRPVLKRGLVCLYLQVKNSYRKLETNSLLVLSSHRKYRASKISWKKVFESCCNRAVKRETIC
jgi:hypothetical protein